MENNQGYKIEDAMKRWFKGKDNLLDCVDFQTSKSLYEVKSCRLFVKCTNGNHKRNYVSKIHKRIRTTQLGRFFVDLENHQGLRACAEEENKIPKYIFVVVIGKQKIWRVKSWEMVDLLITKHNKQIPLIIKDIFNEVWEGE